MNSQSSRLLRILAQVSRLLEIQRNRRAVRQLAHWSDHELNDIGLRRSDVASALAMPMLLDSSQNLSEARRERQTRSGRRKAPPALVISNG